jgi:hypothetical protein
MVEELLAARGIIVSHETVRQWARKFGQPFATASVVGFRGALSSRCQRLLGRGRRRRNRRAITGPNFSTQLRTVS